MHVVVPPRGAITNTMFVLALPSLLYEAIFNHQMLLQLCGVGNVRKLPLWSLEVCLSKRKEAESVCLRRSLFLCPLTYLVRYKVLEHTKLYAKYGTSVSTSTISKNDIVIGN